MSQLQEIKQAQNNLEECFSKRMAELEAQLQTSGPAKETVGKVAEELRTFREIVFSMLSLLRQQITECSRAVDAIESRHRRDCLLFLGVSETQNDSQVAVMNILAKMGLNDFTASHISTCTRIGIVNDDHPRPILVKFSSLTSKSNVWKAKSRLKGTHFSLKEFLTKSRQQVFSKARQHFGMRSCWTQDGIIVVKTKDGHRHKVVTAEELKSLTLKYPIEQSGAQKNRRGQ